MARRRKGLVAVLFPDLHRAYRKAKHDMRPDRAIGRMLSVPEIKAALRTSTRTSAASRKKQVATGKIVPTKKTVKKTAAKKSVAKRTDPYAAARAIPGQNRQAAAKVAKAAQPAAKKTTYKRNPKTGQFDGRKSMRPDDLAAYERAQGGYVDPGMRIRNSQTRRG